MDDLKDRLAKDPANVAIQVRALAGLSDEARARHRANFDRYLEAGADIIEAQAARIEALEGALRPFADAVFNDNGDMTVNRDVKSDHLIAAYFALKDSHNVR